MSIARMIRSWFASSRPVPAPIAPELPFTADELEEIRDALNIRRAALVRESIDTAHAGDDQNAILVAKHAAELRYIVEKIHDMLFKG